MRNVAEIGNQYRRPIIINRAHPCHGYGQEALARRYGLDVHDFLWVTNYRNWRVYIVGMSRSTLVIDPFNLTHEWCEADGIEFAKGMHDAFERIVMAPQCEAALAAWLRIRNPPLYLRMVAAGMCDGENVPKRQHHAAFAHQTGERTP